MSMSNTNEFVIENGVLVKYKGKDLNVVIPDYVTHIGEKAFEKKAKITSVVIPEGVREIGAFAFSECRKLENIHLPLSLEMVRKGAFFDCRNLNELIFPPNTKVDSIPPHNSGMPPAGTCGVSCFSKFYTNLSRRSAGFFLLL